MLKVTKHIMSCEEIKSLIPVPADLAAIKADRDRQVKEIISGQDNRKVVIIGPCSADLEE